MFQRCPICKGKGTLKESPCPTCLGERIINKISGLPPSKISGSPIIYLYIPYYPSYCSFPSPIYPITCTGTTNTGITNIEGMSSVTTKIYPFTYTY